MFILALIVHVIAVVLWIGGVAMVTLVILPAVRSLKSAQEQVELFERIEGRFAWQARGTTLLAGLSGFYLVGRLGLWSSFDSLQYWWLCAMFAVWLIFTFVLFVAEPLYLNWAFQHWAKAAPERTFTLVQRLHWLALILSLIAIAGGVAGSHGLTLFG